MFNECLLWESYLIKLGGAFVNFPFLWVRKNSSERPSDLFKVTQLIIDRLCIRPQTYTWFLNCSVKWDIGEIKAQSDLILLVPRLSQSPVLFLQASCEEIIEGLFLIIMTIPYLLKEY